jgi:hypothetical protein
MKALERDLMVIIKSEGARRLPSRVQGARRGSRMRGSLTLSFLWLLLMCSMNQYGKLIVNHSLEEDDDLEFLPYFRMDVSWWPYFRCDPAEKLVSNHKMAVRR